MWRCEIVSLLACLALACNGKPPSGPATESALERLPPHPLGQELFDAGYVTFLDGGRTWDLDLWSCHEPGSAGEPANTCAGLGITDGEEVFWLQITSREPLLAFHVETVPHAGSSLAVIVTADLATSDPQETRSHTWRLADTGDGPRLMGEE